ncbi:15342_t:CDS:1, partial [Racocetra fulgida]
QTNSLFVSLMASNYQSENLKILQMIIKIINIFNNHLENFSTSTQ